MMNVKRCLYQRTAAQAALFLLSFGYLVGCVAYELEPITYQEAVTQYQQGGGIENYRCALVPANEQYQVLTDDQPIAIEIDEVLFVKIADVVHELKQTEKGATQTAYTYGNLSATLTMVSQFNYSEYGDSNDRFVDLTFKTLGRDETFKTFGAACGL